MDCKFIEMDIPVGVKDQCYNQVSASSVVPVSVLCSRVTFHPVQQN